MYCVPVINRRFRISYLSCIEPVFDLFLTCERRFRVERRPLSVSNHRVFVQRKKFKVSEVARIENLENFQSTIPRERTLERIQKRISA